MLSRIVKRWQKSEIIKFGKRSEKRSTVHSVKTYLVISSKIVIEWGPQTEGPNICLYETEKRHKPEQEYVREAEMEGLVFLSIATLRAQHADR